MVFVFRTRAAIVLILAGLIATIAQGAIHESREWIVDSRTHRTLTLISEQLGFPDTELSKGEAVAWISTLGCNIRVCVVGPVKADARAYAAAIDAWREKAGLPGDVEWSQEDDCSAANFRYHPGRFPMWSSSTQLSIPSLQTALLPLAPHCHLALIDAAWSNEQLGYPPDSTSSAGVKCWNLTAKRAGSNRAVGSISLPKWMPWLLLAWFLIPPVGVAGCLLAGGVIARRQRIPLIARRKLYSKVVMGGSLTAIAMHGVVAAATLPSRIFEPLAQLWFGETFAQFAIPILPSSLVIVLLALFFASRQEKRLMGPSPEERALQMAEPRPVDQRSFLAGKNRYLVIAAVTLTVAGFGGAVVAGNLDKRSPYRVPVRMASTFLTFMPMAFFSLLAKKPAFEVDADTLNQASQSLRLHVESMAAKLDLSPPSSRVLTETMYGRFGAVADSKGLGVTVQAMETLSSAQLDFLVAHELAHLKLQHPRKRLLLTILPPFLFVTPTFASLIYRSQSHDRPSFLIAPMVIPLVCMVPYAVFLRKIMQRQELGADRLAVEVTGAPEVAIDTLRTTALNSPRPGIHDVNTTHPAIAIRIAAIQRMADR